MTLFRVPSTVTWQIPNCSLVAPDGTLIYISYSQVVCLKDSEVFQLEASSWVQGIDCDPDFGRTRYVAATYEDKYVYVWDLDKKAAISGHAAHVEKAQQNKSRSSAEPFPICFTIDKKVVTATKNQVVVYCVASNTFKVNTELTRKQTFTVLKASPYDPNLVAAGTKGGLVVILSLKTMTIIQTMRGHDTEVNSLDWIRVPRAPVEEEDLFGLYSRNDNEEEFGVIKEPRNNRTFDIDDVPGDKVMHEAIENMKEASFDFAEACAALKQDIISNNEDKRPDNRPVVNFADVVESQQSANKPHSDSFSEVSEAPSRDDDFKSVDGEAPPTLTVPINHDQVDDLTLLLSTATEPSVWIWDAQKGCALDNIKLPCGRQSVRVRGFTAKWLNPFNIISNDQNGCLCLWDIEYCDDEKLKIHKSKREFSAKPIIHLAVDRDTENFWSSSMHGVVTCFNINSEKHLYEYSTVSSNIYEFAVNPIDPNVVAIASNKRISLLNVSKMNEKYFVLNNMASQVHCQVLSVAWHPEKENLLAFGTREGRIGIFNTNQLSSSPLIMKPFHSKDVHSVTWGKFRANPTEEMAWTLFSCGSSGSAGKLAYFPQQGPSKGVATEVKFYQNVTTVVASLEFLAIGLFDGTVHLSELSDTALMPFYTSKCSKKLISAFSFSGQKLAVACFDNQILIFTIASRTDIAVQQLPGHTNGITSVSWSLTQPDLLVSCGNDCAVRVWNTKEEKCETEANFEREVFTVIFHPNEADVLIVGGHDFMVTIFDYKKHTIDYAKKSSKNVTKPQGVAMAVANETDVVSKKKKEKKKKVEIQKRLERSVEDTNNRTHELLQEMESMILNDVEDNKDIPESETPKPSKDKATKDKRIQLNYSSIFFLTPRELNRDPIGLLKTLLEPESPGSDRQSRHQKLFSQDMDTVRNLLKEEHTHQIASNVQSVGHLTLPILTMDIKTVILDKISSKTLTEEYIALAPFISHIFWRNTCLAFAYQCIEQGLVLKAITYFLCCYEEDKAIAILCESNHFTEAMAIAQMRKPKEVPEVIKKWTSYLEHCGNFEAAAIVWMTYGSNADALKVLELRSNPSEELQEVIEALKGKNKAEN